MIMMMCLLWLQQTNGLMGTPKFQASVNEFGERVESVKTAVVSGLATSSAEIKFKFRSSAT